MKYKYTSLLHVLLAVILLSVSAAIGYAAVGSWVRQTPTMSRKAPKQPSWKGYWLCWYVSKEPTCKAYGWSKSYNVARRVTLEKCWEGCWTYRPCTFSYCEKLK